MNDNKKLIKQLKGVGFERSANEDVKNNLVLEIEGYQAFCNLNNPSFQMYFGGDYQVAKAGSFIYAPTFPQILAVIKEHTGVDLTKKTKREEIEELKDCIAEMGEEKHRTWERLAALEGKVATLEDVFKTTIEVPFKIMQDAIKSQNNAIDGLKNCVAPTKHKYFFGVDYGTTSDCIDAISYAMLNTKGEAALDHFKARKLYERGKIEFYKVDDKVVINEKAKGLYGFQIEAMQTQTPLTIRKVIDTQPKGYECEYLDNHVGTFPAKWLDEHAPVESPKEKALEWGDRATLIRDYQIGSSCVTVPKGQVVLIAYDVEDARAFVTTPISKVGFYIEVSLLKPL